MATGGSSGDSEDLAARLHHWALQEMKYRPPGGPTAVLPSVDDFRKICRGPMVEIWKYVLDNVRSEGTVKKIKGNLALARHASLVARGRSSSGPEVGAGHVTESRRHLVEQKRKLQQEVTSSRAAIGHVEQDMKRLQQNIEKSEMEHARLKQEVGDTRRKMALLRVNSLHVEEEIERYNEYSNRLQDRVEALSSHSLGSETQFYTKEGEAAGQIESACTKGVREACDSTATFLHSLLKGEFGDNKDTIQRHRGRIWRDVEAVIGQFPANQIVQSLCVTTTDAAHSLSERTNQIDIRRDAEQLKFKYEQGQLVDLSEQPSTVQSVRQLLEEGHARHFRSFIETEKNRNETSRMTQSLTHVTLDVNAQIDALMHDHPEAADLAKKLFETEVMLAGCQANLRAAQNEAETLREVIAHAQRDKQTLQDKYNNIQDFNSVAERKQNLIRALVKQNAASRDKLDAQQAEIEAYIRDSLGQHDANTHSLTSQLQDSVATETQRVVTSELPYLMFSLADSAYKMAVLDLSINRLRHVTDSAQSRTLNSVMRNVNFPSHKAPESLLPSLLELQREATELQMALSRRGDSSDHVVAQKDAQSSRALQNVPVLYKKVKESDQDQLNTVLPVIQKRLTQATEALTHCLNLRDSVQAWWEQPGQDTVPWLLVDDATLRQWKDKFTVAITRLRQLKTS